MQSHTSTTDEQVTDKENIEEVFQEQLTIDLEIQSTDIRQTIDETDMAESNSAASTSKPALSSLEKKSSAKGHPDFHAKNKIRTHYFSSPKDGHRSIFLIFKTLSVEKQTETTAFLTIIRRGLVI